MFRRVTLVRTDISEEINDSIIRVKRIGELGTPLAVTSNRRRLRISSFQEDDIHSHLRENLKPYIENINSPKLKSFPSSNFRRKAPTLLGPLERANIQPV
jgi:hypothetical protein